MTRHFNTAGPCDPADHYMLPPERRLPGVRDLVDQKAYFVVHAPRQVGKTTALMALASALTKEGRYAAALVSMEVGGPLGGDLGAAERAILGAWRAAAEVALPAELQPPPWPEAAPGLRVHSALRAWARHCPRPLVLFLDEIDALRDQVLLSVLRQLRDGHRLRPRDFPWSLALVGLRDVRDYKVASGGSELLHTASPFNIKAESLTMRDFTEPEVAELYAQHTGETGQGFAPEALSLTFELTRGQPWLVNALARQLVQVLATERTKPVGAVEVERAREILIQRQDTHLDSLAERLRDARVRAVIEPMILGDSLAPVAPDDLRFVLDLGLLRETSTGTIELANPIYREIVVRSLTTSVRASLPPITPWWIGSGGGIDWEKLREGFVAFWLQHGEALLGSSPYNEAAPHLVLMAFLHRVVNGGGRVERELAIGSKRLDLCVVYKGDRLGIEVKTWRDSDKTVDPAEAGVEQLDEYLARLGVGVGWLVRFDQRKNPRPLPDRLAVDALTTTRGSRITRMLL